MIHIDNSKSFESYLESLRTGKSFDCDNLRVLKEDVIYVFGHGGKEIYEAGSLICMKTPGVVKFTNHRCRIAATDLIPRDDRTIEAKCRYSQTVLELKIVSAKPTKGK